MRCACVQFDVPVRNVPSPPADLRGGVCAACGARRVVRGVCARRVRAACARGACARRVAAVRASCNNSDDELSIEPYYMCDERGGSARPFCLASLCVRTACRRVLARARAAAGRRRAGVARRYTLAFQMECASPVVTSRRGNAGCYVLRQSEQTRGHPEDDPRAVDRGTAHLHRRPGPDAARPAPALPGRDTMLLASARDTLRWEAS